MTKTPKKKLIKDREASVLREIAQPVDLAVIGSPKIREVIKKMREALQGEEDGVAIAAPQVGESLRIFVVSNRALKLTKSEPGLEDLVFINPEIVKTSKKKRKMEEGCLSVRWLYGEVSRYEKVTITAYDEEGRQNTFGAGGLMAQIFQHEIDHLDGILFIDKAENIRDLPPQEPENGK